MIKDLIIKSYSLVRKRPFLYIVMLIRVVNMIVMLYAAGLTADLFSMITSSSFEGNTFQIIILLITYSFTLLLQYFSFISKQRYEKETHINVKKMIMEKILREYKYISANPGKLTEIITNDSGNVLHLVEAFFELVIEISSVLISFILLVRINVWLSLLILAIRKPSTEDRMVSVYMNNTDYYEYLKDRFNISDGCIEFPSTEFFFENIIDLCIWINKAKGEIHNKNAQLVDILREYRDLEIIKRIGDEYLRKDIELFCEFDRERIKELISYEKKTY